MRRRRSIALPCTCPGTGRESSWRRSLAPPPESPTRPTSTAPGQGLASWPLLNAAQRPDQRDISGCGLVIESDSAAPAVHALNRNHVAQTEVLNVGGAIVTYRERCAIGLHDCAAAQRQRYARLIDQTQQCAMAEFDPEPDHYPGAILRSHMPCGVVNRYVGRDIGRLNGDLVEIERAYAGHQEAPRGSGATDVAVLLKDVHVGHGAGVHNSKAVEDHVGREEASIDRQR